MLYHSELLINPFKILPITGSFDFSMIVKARVLRQAARTFAGDASSVKYI
ncbi:hypothetical protein SAMN05444008_12146 [Cnuella takakiae]|uniref:Uncharacterized protein n=1 Tax=Cnuella takakiae TaxID=1302690 RepID=A0A1M5I1T5_9BACT|nr:hypothetical protein SAMN05444008_12146 [Cnuella takakiae]